MTKHFTESFLPLSEDELSGVYSTPAPAQSQKQTQRKAGSFPPLKNPSRGKAPIKTEPSVGVAACREDIDALVSTLSFLSPVSALALLPRDAKEGSAVFVEDLAALFLYHDGMWRRLAGLPKP